MGRKIRILWTDDEIEILKAHIIFLNEKGYVVETSTNGNDTIDLVTENDYDIIFLDENMPGLSGIDTLKQIKELKPAIPVVMITRSEEEDIMEAAIGSQIADYLIKPVKPKQILLCLKKIIESQRLVNEKTTINYQEEFGRISGLISMANSPEEWIDIYKKLVHWDLQLSKADDNNLREIFIMQEQEANNAFSRFISANYINWFSDKSVNKPLLSPDLFREKVFPLLKNKSKVFFILIDNLRYDQWKILSEEISPYYRPGDESLYYSILPTATQYSRNSIFAGKMPLDIMNQHPEYWVFDDEDEGKNLFEKELLEKQLIRHSLNIKWSYTKISNNNAGNKINDALHELLNNDLNVLIYNFIDLISHARTEIGLIRDLADDEPAYRSLTRSWFQHSPLMELLKELASKEVKIIITTDHGTIRVSNPVKVIGDRATSSNLRYKLGKNLNYKSSQVFELNNPGDAGLPKSNLSSKYIFARNYDYLLYPNNYNKFVNYYKNTFQHGGISMHEMLIPLISLKPL